MDKWYYESEKLIIKRCGEKIDYKIKKGDSMRKEYRIKKDYDYLRSFFPKINRIKKEDFEKIFIQDNVKVVFAEIDERDIKDRVKLINASVICEYKGKYKELEIPFEFFADCSKYIKEQQFKNLEIDFEHGKVVKGKKMRIWDYKFEDTKEKISEIKLSDDFDINKQQIDIFNFI